MLCKGNPFLCSQFKTSFVSFCRAAPSREIERGNKFTSGIFSDMNPTSQVIPHGGERWDSNMVLLGTFDRQEFLPFHLGKWKWQCKVHLRQLISCSAQLNIVLAQQIFLSYSGSWWGTSMIFNADCCKLFIIIYGRSLLIIIYGRSLLIIIDDTARALAVWCIKDLAREGNYFAKETIIHMSLVHYSGAFRI